MSALKGKGKHAVVVQRGAPVEVKEGAEDALLQPRVGERMGEKRIWEEKQKCDTSETGPPGRQGELLIPTVTAVSGVCMG